MDKEEKYIEIREKLRNLQPVKASDNFVHNLHSKIVELEAEKRKEHEKRFDENRGGFLRNLFGNMQYPWLVPAAGFTVLIFFVFYITFLNKNVSENKQPLLTDQKQEITEPKNTEPGENYIPDTDPDNTLTEKESLPGKDIAGELKTEKNEKIPAPVDAEKSSTDRDEEKSNRMELKAKQTDRKEGQEEKEKTHSEIKKEVSKNRETQNDATTDGKNAITPQEIGKSLKTTESSVPKDSNETEKKKAKENDSLKNKIDNKLLRINKSNLEKIREEILK